MCVSITYKALSAVVIASWLSCASQPRQSNWKSPDAPCANFDDLRKPLLRNIGVKIDAPEPWADGFRRALRFWNTVLAANLHEEAYLCVCNIRIVDGALIAVSQAAAKDMNSAEIYATAVHEIGHILGLKHNVNIHSVMYFLDVDSTVVLDRKDILNLSRHHELRRAILANGFVPILASSMRSP